jgi:hypothetical protein
MIVAFTATPAPATVTLFGESFDTYSEAVAIAEGYIVDVAASIILDKTLYNLHWPVVKLSGFFLQRPVPAFRPTFATLAAATRVWKNSLSHVAGTMDFGATLSNAQ